MNAEDKLMNAQRAKFHHEMLCYRCLDGKPCSERRKLQKNVLKAIHQAEKELRK